MLNFLSLIRPSAKSGKNQGNGFCLKISGKNQGIRLMLETVSENIAFLPSINRFPSMLKDNSQKRIMLIVKLLVLIFHDGNRA